MDRRNGGGEDVAGAPPRDDEALEFVRFCHRRRHVGWPELYDEMCAVAGRGLYRGYGTEELGEIGIGFGLFQMPSLAALVARVVAEDVERRRRLAEGVRTTVALADQPGRATAATAMTDGAPPAASGAMTEPEPVERPASEVGAIRLAAAAGA